MGLKSLLFFKDKNKDDEVAADTVEVNSSYSTNKSIKDIVTRILSIIFILIGLTILISGIVIMDISRLNGKLVIILSCFIFLSALFLYKDNDEKTIIDVHNDTDDYKVEVTTHEEITRLVSNINKKMQMNISKSKEGDLVNFIHDYEKEKILVLDSQGEIGYINKSFTRNLLKINTYTGNINEVSINEKGKYVITLKILYNKTL